MKIIKIENCDHCKEILLFVDIAEGGSNCVKIIAWHTYEDEEYFQEETVEFGQLDDILPGRFIADFSISSANEFANNFQK